MALIYHVGEIVETQFLGTYYGTPVKIVIHWRVKPANLPSTDIVQLVQDVCVLFGSNCVSQMKWQGTRHRRKSPNQEQEYREDLFGQVSGGASGDGMPQQLATVWRIVSGLPGGAGNGRFYLPGMPMSHWANNAWSNTANVVHNGLKGQLQQFLSLNGSDPRVTMGTWALLKQGGAFAPMVQMRPGSYPGVQRSRHPPIW